MVSIFSETNPVFFGCGSSKVVGEQLKEFRCKKVLVIYDKGVKVAGIVDMVNGYIRDAGIEIVEYDGVMTDPPDYTIDEAAELATKENADGIVAIGGGSAMDTGKGVRIVLANTPPINKFFLPPGAPPLPNEKPMKPLIVIPTTSGTGSEVSPGGIITDSKTHMKNFTVCPVSLGLIDPELTVGLPAGITAATGLDALCHAVESLTSRTPNRISELLSKEAITLIGKYLPIACKVGSNIEAREGMMLASTLATMSIAGPYCHIGHDIGQPLGGTFHIPHGTACVAVLGEAMEFVAPVVPDKVKMVAECLGANIPDKASPEEIGKIASAAIHTLMNEVRIPKLKSFVKSKEELLTVVPNVQKISMFFFSPRPLTEEDIKNILIQAYDAE